MWFGTMDGLDRFDGYEFMVFRHDPFDSTSLSDNSITKLFMDSRSQLWVGTLHGGLNLFDPLDTRFIHFLDPSTGNEKDNGNYIRAVAEDTKGNLWMGTFGNGIYEFKFSSKKMRGLYLPEKIIHYTKQTGNDNGLGSNFINYIFSDKEDRLWVSSSDGPLQEVDINSDHIYFSTPRFSDLNPEITIKDQTVRYDFKKCHLFQTEKPPHPYIVYDVYEDENRNLWMAGNGGLYILKAKSDTLINIQPTLGPIHVKNVTLSVTQGMKSHIFWLGILGGVRNIQY
jgi:ligand-binding sensor domain-containing protein